MNKYLSILTMVLVLIIGAGSSGTARATNWFFSPSGSDSNAGTSGLPWLNPSNHNPSYKPGDVLTVGAGTYMPSFGWDLTASGSASGGFITLQCAQNQASKVIVTANSQNGIFVTEGASYWDIRGCDVTATGSNGSAISVAGGFNTPLGPLHHIIIEGNVAHDSSCEGIAVSGNTNVDFNSSGQVVKANAVDYITIRSNIVFNNGRTSGLHCSGIAIYEPVALDSGSGNHLVIEGNVVYGNFDCDSCSATATDGHGIVLDDFSMSQNQALAPFAFKQPTFVAHNLSYNNGGKGIEVFASQDVLVTQNTAFNNNQDVNECGLSFEIGALLSTESTFTSNEAQALYPTNCANSPEYAYAEYANGSATGDVFQDNTGFSASGTTYFVHNSPSFSFGSTNQ